MSVFSGRSGNPFSACFTNQRFGIGINGPGSALAARRRGDLINRAHGVMAISHTFTTTNWKTGNQNIPKGTCALAVQENNGEWIEWLSKIKKRPHRFISTRVGADIISSRSLAGAES